MQMLNPHERDFWKAVVVELLPILVGNNLDESFYVLVERFVEAERKYLELEHDKSGTTEQRQEARAGMLNAWRDAMGCGELAARTPVHNRLAGALLLADRVAIEFGYRVRH